MQLTTLFSTFLLAFLQYLSGPSASTLYQQKEDKLAPYVGTWVGRSTTGEFKLVLEERKKIRFSDSISMDLIAGWYSYGSSAGTVNGPLPRPTDKPNMMLGSDDDNPGGIFGSFYDVVNRKGVDIRLSFTSTAKNQLSWVIVREREAFSFDPAKPVLPGVSVPSNMVLTKVK